MKTVDDFVANHPEGWTFEQETELRNELSEEGFDTTKNVVAQTIDTVLRTNQETKEVETPSMIQTPIGFDSQVNSLEVEASLIELNSRIAEIEAAGRDFLMVSKSSDEEDLEAFISKFSDYGFMVEEPAVSYTHLTLPTKRIV